MTRATLIKEPLTREVCTGCGRPIYRNLAFFDDQPWHFGCLKKSHGRPTHQCLNCGTYLSGGDLTKAYFDDKIERSCPNCGSTDLRRLRREPWLRP